MELAPHEVQWRRQWRRHKGQTARFQKTLRRLAIIDEGFAEDEAGLGLGLVMNADRMMT